MRTRAGISRALPLAGAVVFCVAMLATRAGAVPTDRYVDATLGSDTSDCSSIASPCLTIGYAVTQAGSGDTIHVAAGAYPEMVSVTKSLTFLGANATVPAGVSSGARGAESVVEGFRSPGSPHPSSAYAFNVTIDGFTVSPQGNTSLISASGHHLVALFGGPDVEIKDNIFDGGPYDAGCGYTCTDMTDQALFVQSGTFTVSDNTFTDFRAPIDISQNDQANPIVSGTISNNVFSHITNRAIWLRQGGGAAAAPTYPGVTVSGNDFDATGWNSPDWSPGGLILTTGGNTVTGNTFTDFGSGVFAELCDGNPVFTATNTFTGNHFLGNDSGIQYYAASAPCTTPSYANITNNDFVGNTSSGVGWDGPSGFVPPNALNAPCNWWGAAGGAGSAGADTASAQVTTRPWLVSSGGYCDGGVPMVKTDCQHNGWKVLVDRQGLPFVSQGDCMKAIIKTKPYRDKGTATFDISNGMTATRKATHLGASTSATNNLQLQSIAGNTVTVTYGDSIIAANGDHLTTTATATIDITNVNNNTPGPLPFSAVETITGGTGRFVGARGSFTMTGLVDLNTSTLKFKSSGTITYSARGCKPSPGLPC